MGPKGGKRASPAYRPTCHRSASTPSCTPATKNPNKPHGTQVAGMVPDRQVIENDKDIAFSIGTARLSLFDAASERRL